MLQEENIETQSNEIGIKNKQRGRQNQRIKKNCTMQHITTHIESK